MSKKKMRFAFLWMVLFAGGLAVQAGDTAWRGVSIDYGSASTNWVDGDLVLKYTGSSSLTISNGAAKADVLVVGGGGSGSSGGRNSQKQGYGGRGGEVVEMAGVLLSGDHIIAVGGGANAVSGNSSSRSTGKAGNPSSLSGSANLTAAGGEAGGSSAVSGKGTASDITGVSVTYAVDGASRSSNTAAQNGADGTGSGGSGGYAGALSGKGGSGVVVVRLKEAYAATKVTLAGLTLGEGEEVSVFKDASTGVEVSIVNDFVQSVKLSSDDVARVERTKDGKMVIVGAGTGSTTATITTIDDSNAMTIYAVDVTVRPSIELQDVALQRGETITAFKLQESDEAISFTPAEVKSVKFSMAEVVVLRRAV